MTVVWPITHLINEHPGEIMLDIGANVGTITADMARRAGHVYAFEPHPDNVAKIYERCRAGRLENVTIIEEALGCRTGMFKLYTCGSNPGGHTLSEKVAGPKTWDHDPGRFIMVKETRGDDFVAGLNAKVGIIKIDVEGYECQVLEGLAETLKNHRPIIALETHQTIDVERLGDLLKGYQIQGGELKMDSAYVCF